LEQANLLEKHEAASISPKVLFMSKDEFKDFAFDERGVPTHDKEGNELTKSAKKVCQLFLWALDLMLFVSFTSCTTI